MLAGMLLMILEALGGFITMMLLARAVMRAMRMSFVGQLGQFTLTMTNWLVQPCQRFLPVAGRMDICSLTLAWAVQSVLVAIGFLLSGRSLGNPAMLLAVALTIGVLELLRTALYLLMGAVIVGAALSWVNPYSPLAPAINRITKPFLEPFRRIIPPVSGIDLSPLALLLVIQVVLYVLQNMRSRFTYLLF